MIFPTTKRSFTLLIADTNFIAVTGLKALIQKHIPFASFVETKSVDSVMIEIRRQKFDLVYLDYLLPGGDIFNLVETLISKSKHCKVLVATDRPVKILAKAFLKIGCHGYIAKSIHPEEIITAVRKIVVDGKKYISSDLMMQFAEDYKIGTFSEKNPFDSLGIREMQVVTHLLLGKKVPEICGAMVLHSSTVRSHKATAFKKLNVNSLLELRGLAEKNNLL